MKDMHLSKVKYLKTQIKFYERYASIKSKIYKNTNTFLWMISLYQK